MKILIIAQKEFAYRDGKFVGGIQKVEADQVQVLAMDEQTEVHIFLPADTDPNMFKQYKNVTVIRSSSDSQDQKSPGDKAKSTKLRSQEIQKVLRSEKYDCVIVHDWSTSIHGLFLDEFKHVPSIVYLHNMPVDSGGIQMFNRIDTYTQLHKQGSISTTVSNTCASQWVKEIERKIESPNQSKLMKPETIEHFQSVGGKIFETNWPGLVEKTYEPQLSKLRFATMISRLNDNKRIDLAAKICYEIGIPLFLFCPSPRSPEQQAILDSFARYFPLENVRMDADRDQMMDTLCRSSLHIIPSTESFSLVALEANSCGVPCLIVDRGYKNSPHEATQKNDVFNISYDTKMPKADLKEYLMKMMANTPLSFETRQEISKNIGEFYSPRRVGERLMALIVKAKQRKEEFMSTQTEDEGIFGIA